MNKKELYDRWVDDNGEEFIFTGYPDVDRKQFYEDLDAWYLDKQQKELEETKAKLIEHMDRLENEDLEKAWKMDPKDMQEQVQKQLKKLNTVQL